MGTTKESHVSSIRTTARFEADGRPWLSLVERDRRHELARTFLREHGYDAMIVAGLRGRERFDTYLSGEVYEGVVLLPLDSEPVYLVTQAHRITLRHDRSNADIEPWIADARPGVQMFGTLAAAITERGLQRGRFAVVGLESRGPMEMEGLITQDAWSTLITAHPEATFQDESMPWSLRTLPKSAEELEVARQAALAGEDACAAMLEATRVGATDADVYGAILGSIHGSGGYTAHPHLLLRVGPDSLGWGPPNTFTHGARPRRIEDGDIVLAEIFTCLAGIETQQEMTIAVGSAGERMSGAADAARASYEVGRDTLLPGALFSEVCDAMSRPIQDAGYWSLGPNIHSVSPLAMVDAAFRGVEKVAAELPDHPPLRTVPPHGDAPIEPNWLMVLEPNAMNHRSRALIGGTVIVGADGVEELNSLPCRMHTI
jgi:Xaa-Pro aminopeptidase